MKFRKNRLADSIMGLVLAAAIALAAGAAGAADDPANVIKYRRIVMGAISNHISAIAGIVKGKVSYTSHIAAHARAMHEMSTLLLDIFPEGSGVGKTRAKPEIWTQRAKFEDAIAAFREASGKLADIADSGDMAAIFAQVKRVGKTCGGCHKPFRKKKKKN